MIKLVIDNHFEYADFHVEDLDHGDDENPIEFYIKYDKVYENGSIYEFETLKEVQEFIDTHHIDFTEKYYKILDGFNWDNEILDLILRIDKNEDNTLIYSIDSHTEAWD